MSVPLETRSFLSELLHNFKIQNDVYMEEFIEIGGSEHLMSLAVLLDGSLLGYCLQAFYITTIYTSGVEFIRQQPDNIEKLYQLLDKDESAVRKNALGILCSLLRDMEDAFGVINKAAVAYGYQNDKSPYVQLVDALGSRDEDLKERVLHFINSMIHKAPNEELCCAFQSRLENLGIYEECGKIVKTNHEKLKRQLIIFHQNNKAITKSTMYELEIHKSRITELEQDNQAMKRKLLALQEQQNFFKIMKGDYAKFYDLARKSMEKPTLFNPFIATGHYKKDDLMKLPMLKREIVDLRDEIQKRQDDDKSDSESNKSDVSCFVSNY